MFLQALVLLRLGHALLFAAVLVGGGGRELGAGLGAALVVFVVLVLGVEGLLNVSNHDFAFELLFGLLQVLLHRGSLGGRRGGEAGDRKQDEKNLCAPTQNHESVGKKGSNNDYVIITSPLLHLANARTCGALDKATAQSRANQAMPGISNECLPKMREVETTT